MEEQKVKQELSPKSSQSQSVITMPGDIKQCSPSNVGVSSPQRIDVVVNSSLSEKLSNLLELVFQHFSIKQASKKLEYFEKKYTIPPSSIVSIVDKKSNVESEYVTYSGVANCLKQVGCQSLRITNILQYPNRENGFRCIVSGQLIGLNGEVYEDIADASPEDVGQKAVKHFIRIASTRVKARLIKDYLGIEINTLDDIPEIPSEGEKVVRKSDTAGQFAQKNNGKSQNSTNDDKARAAEKIELIKEIKLLREQAKLTVEQLDDIVFRDTNKHLKELEIIDLMKLKNQMIDTQNITKNSDQSPSNGSQNSQNNNQSLQNNNNNIQSDSNPPSNSSQSTNVSSNSSSNSSSSNIKIATKKQLMDLFTIATKRNIDQAEIINTCHEKYGCEPKNLNSDQILEFSKFIEDYKNYRSKNT